MTEDGDVSRENAMWLVLSDRGTIDVIFYGVSFRLL